MVSSCITYLFSGQTNLLGTRTDWLNFVTEIWGRDQFITFDTPSTPQTEKKTIDTALSFLSNFSNQSHCFHWLPGQAFLSVCNLVFANKSRSNLATKTCSLDHYRPMFCLIFLWAVTKQCPRVMNVSIFKVVQFQKWTMDSEQWTMKAPIYFITWDCNRIYLKRIFFCENRGNHVNDSY